MAGIVKIHGFERQFQTFSSRGNQFVLNETILVEMTTPTENMLDIVNALPSYASGPGPAALNPEGLTFTLHQSRHPYSNRYTLNAVNNLKRHPEKGGHFWYVPLTFMTAEPTLAGILEPKKRKDQKKRKPDSEDPDDNDPITIPWERPPVFSGSTKIVNRPSRFDANDEPIQHTNDEPITTPVNLPVPFLVWNWSWNIAATQFDMQEFESMTNQCNSDALVIRQGDGSLAEAYFVTVKHLKCMGFSFSEAWESPDGAVKEYHYVTIKGSFELNLWDSWDNPPLSMHTHGLVGGVLKPIEINDAGYHATSPWPLSSTGVALTKTQMATTSNFGKLQAGGATLVVCPSRVFQTFFDKYKLKLPHKMD